MYYCTVIRAKTLGSTIYCLSEKDKQQIQDALQFIDPIFATADAILSAEENLCVNCYSSVTSTITDIGSSHPYTINSFREKLLKFEVPKDLEIFREVYVKIDSDVM